MPVIFLNFSIVLLICPLIFTPEDSKKVLPVKSALVRMSSGMNAPVPVMTEAELFFVKEMVFNFVSNI